MLISPGFVCFCFFFHFFEILIFRVVRRVKGQKMTQNDKKLSPSKSHAFISQEPYNISSSFMVNMCDRITSPGVFFTFFLNFNFLGQKMVLNEKKKMFVALYISGSIHQMIVICGTCV